MYDNYLKEQEARAYLKTFSAVDISNSTYLFNIDFDNDPIDDICSSIESLYNETLSLQRLIESNFCATNEDGDKVLVPSSPKVQGIIINDYIQKCGVLNKCFANDSLVDCMRDYMTHKQEGSKNK